MSEKAEILQAIRHWVEKAQPGHAVSFVNVTELLPDLQAAISEARTEGGWDMAKLNQIVAHEFGFLGSFISARVEELSLEEGRKAEYLLTEFHPPANRDLDGAERIFERGIKRAAAGDLQRGSMPGWINGPPSWAWSAGTSGGREMMAARPPSLPE